jgi:hypothetical protein
MPTKTKPTQERMAEILATKVMGWQRGDVCEISVQFVSYKRRIYGPSVTNWDPFTDLNAVHEIEKRLTEDQQSRYMVILNRSLLHLENVPGFYDSHLWRIRHAAPADCAEALARVVAPEEFQDE